MAKIKPGANPFYVLLVVAGVLFLVTACAFFVMTLLGSRSATAAAAAPSHPLLVLMERHGAALMLWEVAALTVTSLLAMATDRYWIRRGKSRSSERKPRTPD